MDNRIVTIGRWHYLLPDLRPNQDGNIVIIHKSSVAPAEIYEWGIDAEKHAYERYRWCEDDFYEDSNYCNSISIKELVEEIDRVMDLFVKNNFVDFANEYQNIKSKITAGVNENK